MHGLILGASRSPFVRDAVALARGQAVQFVHLVMYGARRMASVRAARATAHSGPGRPPRPASPLPSPAIGRFTGALPNLVVAGAMKCGTTSLHAYLGRHPAIAMSRPKEVDYFAGSNSGRPLEWYGSLFDPAAPVRGESSQNYTKRHHPLFGNAIDRMAKVIPDAKIIYLVRDPVERYISHRTYNYYTVRSEEDRWAGEIDHYVKTGLYHYQIAKILQHYDLSRIMVVDAHDLATRRHETMNAIFAFLGVDPLPDDGRFGFESNTRRDRRVPLRLGAHPMLRIANRIAPAPTERVLLSGPAQRLMWQRSRALASDPADLARVRDICRADVAKLRALTGQPFAHWSV